MGGSGCVRVDVSVCKYGCVRSGCEGVSMWVNPREGACGFVWVDVRVYVVGLGWVGVYVCVMGAGEGVSAGVLGWLDGCVCGLVAVCVESVCWVDVRVCEGVCVCQGAWEDV